MSTQLKKTFTYNVLVIFILLISTTICFANNAYVVNTISNSLSKIDVESRTVEMSFARLGSAPNAAANRIEFHNNKAYAVLTFENAVQVVDLNSPANSTRISLENSSAPNDIEIYNGYAYVSGNNTDKVYKIDLADNSVSGFVDVGRAPEGLLAHQGKLYVANTGYNGTPGSFRRGQISVIDINNFQVVDTIFVAKNPRGITRIGDKLHIPCTGTYNASGPGKVVVVDLSNNSVLDSVECGGTPATIVYGNNGKAYVGLAYPTGVVVYNSETFNIESRPSDNIFVGGNALAVDNGMLAIAKASYTGNSEIRFYDLGDNSLIFQVGSGMGAVDIVFYSRTQTSIDDNPCDVVDVSTVDVCPNPIIGSASISLSRSNNNDENIEVDIFNIKGQKVNSISGVGNRVKWNGKSIKNKDCSAGIYFLRVKSKDKIYSKKVMLIK